MRGDAEVIELVGFVWRNGDRHALAFGGVAIDGDRAIVTDIRRDLVAVFAGVWRFLDGKGRGECRTYVVIASDGDLLAVAAARELILWLDGEFHALACVKPAFLRKNTRDDIERLGLLMRISKYDLCVIL